MTNALKSMNIGLTCKDNIFHILILDVSGGPSRLGCLGTLKITGAEFLKDTNYL